jgi:hypothetical protein
MQNRIDYEGLQNRRQMRTKKLLSQKDFFDSLQINRYARPLVISAPGTLGTDSGNFFSQYKGLEWVPQRVGRHFDDALISLKAISQ